MHAAYPGKLLVNKVGSAAAPQLRHLLLKIEGEGNMSFVIIPAALLLLFIAYRG
jgi:hypothetical protein